MTRKHAFTARRVASPAQMYLRLAEDPDAPIETEASAARSVFLLMAVFALVVALPLSRVASAHGATAPAPKATLASKVGVASAPDASTPSPDDSSAPGAADMSSAGAACPQASSAAAGQASSAAAAGQASSVSAAGQASSVSAAGASSAAAGMASNSSAAGTACNPPPCPQASPGQASTNAAAGDASTNAAAGQASSMSAAGASSAAAGQASASGAVSSGAASASSGVPAQPCTVVPPPVIQPPQINPPPGTPPQQGVLPAQVQPAPVVAGVQVSPRGSARLSGPSGCVSKAFSARVTGSRIRRVVFILDGRTVATLTHPNGQRVWSLRIDPGKLKTGTHRIVARAEFTAGTAARAKKSAHAAQSVTKVLSITFQRCARQAVKPLFTG
jgi:hypothetical protein